jgi:sporulation protein YlmC with PRC-barrel domain
LSDLAIVETGKLSEVTQVVVARPYGHPALTIPWDKVLLISNHEVVLDLAEDALAQFERAPQENLILLHDHILDKKILDMDDHEVEVVYDVKLVFQNGELHAAEVDYSRYRALRRLGLHKLAKLLADRNKENRVSWLYVQPLPEQLGSFAGNIKLKIPKAELNEIHPADLADILEELEGGQRVALFNALDSEQASDTLEEVEPRVQRQLIHAIEKERAATLINEMSPAQAADILAILPRDEAGVILKLIDRDKSSKVEHIIGEHNEQILLYALPKLIRLPAITSAAEVLDRYRELATGKDVVTYVYVTDGAGTLKGWSIFGKSSRQSRGRRSATS